MGGDAKSKKVKIVNRGKFVFDWWKEEDMLRDLNLLYDWLYEVVLMFG